MRASISTFVLMVILFSCSDDQGGNPISVTSFSPTKGLVGSEVIITGKGFSETPDENLVTLGNVAAEVVASTDTEIIAIVPSIAGQNGIITVQVGSKKVSAPGSFTVQNQPEVVEFFPAQADVGGTVNITCRYAGTTSIANIVKFNSVQAEVVGVSIANATGDPITRQIITVKVPIAATGKLTVEYDGLETTVTESYLIRPYVTNFSPKGGPTGTQISVTGLNFVPGQTEIRIGGFLTTIVSATETNIIAEVVTSKFGLLTADNNIAPEYFMGTTCSNSPASGPVGTWVEVFNTAYPRNPRPIVKFNGIQATELDYENGVKARVPAGATTGKITLELGGLTSTSVNNFTVQ